MLVFEHWNYYSMLLLKVRKVKRSGTDYCLSVPLSILPGLNAQGGCFKTYLTCGELLMIYYYVLIAAMYMRARSNVQGIVIRWYGDTIRSEVSCYDKIYAHRLWKARQP